MSERKSPTQSATLYKIGTKKKGNDGNIWIIVENKNNIKKWQLYKKPTKIEKSQKPIKLNDIPIEKLYEKVDFKKNNWNKWLENCTPELKSFVNKIRKSYTEFNTSPLGDITCTSTLSSGKPNSLLMSNEFSKDSSLIL